jgi:hypothetical protein
METRRELIIKKAREMTGKRMTDVINRLILKTIRQTIESIMRDVTEVDQMIDTGNITHPLTQTLIIIIVREKSQVKSTQKAVKNPQIITHPMKNESTNESIKEANIIEIALKFKFYFLIRNFSFCTLSSNKY